jgi:ribosomal protein S18 acetylase RimI-like enzyme
MLYVAAGLDEAGTPPDAMRANPSFARYVEGWGRGHDAGVLAVDEATGRPVGAAWMRLLTGERRGYGWVDDATPELAIAVLPAYRGRGIGTRLLSALIAAARRSYPALSLSVRATNPAARLYRRLGFEPVPGTEVANRPRGTSVTMKLAFPP